MFSTLVEKELKAIIQSPKFVGTFAVCTTLILLSVVIGIKEYEASVAQYETARELVNQQISESTSFWQLGHKVYREPGPMQIFVSGVDFDVGRLSNISVWSEVKLVESSYSNKPLFAVFRFIDFTFIVLVVLSLFAILFTYDAINGERESGTLKLAFSNAIPRGKYLFAKFVGSWLGLTIPILIPILLSLMLLILFSVPMDGASWLKLIILILVSILYFTFFIAFGLFVSSVTRHSSVSFLVLLVVWIALVLIVPRGATMTAWQLVDVPSVSSVESQKMRFRLDRFVQSMEDRNGLWKERRKQTEGMTRDERRQYYEDNQATFQEEDEAIQQEVDADIAEYNRLLNEELNNAKAERQRLAFVLSRFSPSSAYKLAAMNLAGTNTSLKRRYEDRMFRYRESFKQYVDQKRKEEREERIRQAKLGNTARPSTGTDAQPLDSSDMPRFIPVEESLVDVMQPSVIDLGLLSVYTLLAFAGAFVAFIRYDVR